MPDNVLDDSVSIFPLDSLGIIGEDNLGVFFGVTDTVNGDSSGGDISAEWVFDVSGADNLSLSIDMGAMGDFETSDSFTWTYQIDDGPIETAFQSSVDESTSYNYVMDGGEVFTLDDPIFIVGIQLTNSLAIIDFHEQG